jgi:hypothetical protein
MSSGSKDGYRRLRRGLVGVALGAVVTLGGALGAFADEYGEYGEAEKYAAGGGYEEYEYAANPYVVYYEDTVYSYATTKDGEAQYYTYDGEWSEPYTYEDQPVKYQWEPAAVAHGDKQYLFYAGEDGKYYHSNYDGSEWSAWEDISGEYTFVAAPYANKYGDDVVSVYGAADDGYVYYSTWADGSWSEWAPVSADYTSGEYQPYAVDWGGYNNVFWTGDDGYVYWNRYDTEAGEWTGEKQLPYAADEYAYKSAPYALGYSVDEKLYAYAVTEDGKPHWNTFDGDAWSGWAPYESEYGWTAEYQPYAYEYKEVQYIYTTADDGHAYYTTYDGETWSEWTDLGENYDYDLQSYEYEDAYYLTYTGENGYLYYKEYKAADDSGY